jgi:cytochrome b pre-mRNA-processing protein 3
MMALPLFRRSPRASAAEVVYARIVEQARSPALYRDLGVPDTLDGRFEMLILHAILYFRRLRSEDEASRRVGQAVFEVMCRDFDASLREIGIGDLTVPKKMKAMVQAFYGRGAAYDEALDGGDSAALAAALARNVLPGEPAGQATALADYVRAALSTLARQPVADLVSTGPRVAADAFREEQSA